MSIQTVEHLLATLYVLGVDGVEIDVEGDEIPLLDGGAGKFYQVIKPALIPSAYKKPVFKPINPFWIRQGESFLLILPAETFRITYVLDWQEARGLEESVDLEINEDNFLREVAPARTFTVLSQVSELLKRGLIKGGSLDAALVYVDEIPSPEDQKELRRYFRVKKSLPLKLRNYLNPNPALDNECVRHKVLDLIGDLALLGLPIQGHVIARNTGHDIHVRFVSELDKESRDTFPHPSALPQSLLR